MGIKEFLAKYTCLVDFMQRNSSACYRSRHLLHDHGSNLLAKSGSGGANIEASGDSALLKKTSVVGKKMTEQNHRDRSETIPSCLEPKLPRQTTFMGDQSLFEKHINFIDVRQVQTWSNKELDGK
jgi:hypothetical protein